MKKILTILLLFTYFTILFSAQGAEDKNGFDPDEFIPPPKAFDEPQTPPAATITSNSMCIKNEQMVLDGSVKAVWSNKDLICGKAFMKVKPYKWLLATNSPVLHGKERIPERKVIQEFRLEAKNISADEGKGILTASPSVYLRIEERSWDLASFSWCIITSEDLIAASDSERIIFSGRVKLRDAENYGEGNRLDYARKQAIAVLSGNARMDYYQFNKETGKKEKRTLKGNIINYNLETKEAVSE